MNEIIINNMPVLVKEYGGQRVVTLKDIDTVHGRPEGTAKRNFKANRKHFIEGEDFFKVCADEIRTNKICEISSKTHSDIILITETGYLMLVKSFTDELAWKVQRELVNGYFRTQQKVQDIESIISRTVAQTVAALMPLLQNQQTAGKTVIVNNVPAVRKRTRTRKNSYQPLKMETLPPELKQQADAMIITGEYSQQQIANFVTNHGISISQMAVSRYIRKYFTEEQEVF
ncbi:MAG: ORF6N domain-containing protein [Oscillospiraceae bacterium]|nr:ORF6N domain-containing protein [Oscillospiraceae bacterium]